MAARSTSARARNGTPWSPRSRSLAVAGAAAGGWLLSALLYPGLGPQALALAILPALAGGLLLGRRWGVLLGTASVPVQIVLLDALGYAGWREVLARGGLLDALVAGLGLLAGWGRALHLRDLERQAQLRDQALHDPLTGLPNRRYLAEAWQRESHRATRQGQSIGVLLLDLDRFKQINDRYGHQAGDAILRQVAALLVGAIRRSDIACRWGGEEFVLALPDAGVEATRERAERLRAAVRQLPAGLTVSIGIALFPRDGMSLEAVMSRADAALYEAKRRGRDRIEVYGAEIRAAA